VSIPINSLQTARGGLRESLVVRRIPMPAKTTTLITGMMAPEAFETVIRKILESILLR
jgi:hypothetical protein